MKFVFNKNALINEISIAQESISVKNALSILSYVSLTTENNVLVIKSTDTKIYFQAKIPVEIEEAGTTVVFCSKLMSILSLLPEGDINFEVQEKDGVSTAVIKHSVKKIRFNLICMAPDNFPEFENHTDLNFFDIPSKDFKEMVAHTSFAVSTDETRYFLNGVFFEKDENNLVLVATDGKRLAYESKSVLAEVENFNSIIVHPKILGIIAKYASDEGNLSIATTEKNIVFKFSNYVLSASLIDGQFPNYRRVIPENQPSKFQVQKDELMLALKRISVMTDQKVLRIFFDITPGVLSLHSDSGLGEAREEIPCQYAGENLTIAMNIKHLEDALKSMNCENVVFNFSDANKAVLIKPESETTYFDIIMPMMIS